MGQPLEKDSLPGNQFDQRVMRAYRLVLVNSRNVVRAQFLSTPPHSTLFYSTLFYSISTDLTPHQPEPHLCGLLVPALFHLSGSGVWLPRGLPFGTRSWTTFGTADS